MKIRIVLLLATVFMSLQAVAQTGKIAGTVADENNDPIIGAIIEVLSSGTKTASAVTNIDGNYEITVKTGKHEIVARYSSYKTVRIKDILVSKNKTTTVNINFKPSALDEVVIKHVQPLITKDGNVNTHFSKEDIKHAPTLDMTKTVGSGSGVVHDNRGGSINAAGSRSGNTVTKTEYSKIHRAPPYLPKKRVKI